jgi:pimeloyl-ACP methyl ester carboxylesterase
MKFVQCLKQTCALFFALTLFSTFGANSRLLAQGVSNISRIPKSCLLGYRTSSNDFTPIETTTSKSIETAYGQLDALNKTLFNTAILRDPENTRIILKKLPPSFGTVHEGTVPLIGSKDKRIPFTFFDRGSNELIIIGGGFANPREMLAPLVGIFADYNIVMFDHVGHGLDLKSETYWGKFFKKAFGVDFTALKGGSQEENEVLSIREHFTKLKAYSSVYGVGLCYSTGIFIKVAAKHPGTFNKLILDGAWENPRKLMKSFTDTPELFFDPQRANPSEQQMGWKKRLIYNLYWNIITSRWGQRYLNGNAANLETNSTSLEKLTDVPVLFFHGFNDLVISEKQFNAAWDAKFGEKFAIITDSRHLQNYLKYKHLYYWCTNCFLDLGTIALEDSFTSPEALTTMQEALRQYKEAKKSLAK